MYPHPPFLMIARVFYNRSRASSIASSRWALVVLANPEAEVLPCASRAARSSRLVVRRLNIDSLSESTSRSFRPWVRSWVAFVDRVFSRAAISYNSSNCLNFRPSSRKADYIGYPCAESWASCYFRDAMNRLSSMLVGSYSTIPSYCRLRRAANSVLLDYSLGFDSRYRSNSLSRILSCKKRCISFNRLLWASGNFFFMGISPLVVIHSSFPSSCLSDAVRPSVRSSLGR